MNPAPPGTLRRRWKGILIARRCASVEPLAAELAGKRLKRRMKAGQILTDDCLESPPLIERGEEITLIVHYKNIIVGCPGKAWQNGRLGEKILVRNQYGKNLTGTVQDANTVLITQ